MIRNNLNISQFLIKHWKFLFPVYCAICVFAFLCGSMAVNLLGTVLEFCVEYKIAWLVIFISFGGKIIHELLTQEIIIKSGFISILTVITEGATFGVIIDSSLRFLNALVKQFWVKGKEKIIFFEESYFGEFEFLTLTFAAIFLLFYSLNSAFDAIKKTLRQPSISTSTISPLEKNDFDPDTNT